MFAAAVGGLLASTLLVWLGWLIQIEGRAFQCTDSGWPMAWFSTDMTLHRQAGDTLSRGWTWEEVERVGRIYRAAFVILWAGMTTMIYGMWVRRLGQNRQEEVHQSTRRD